MRGHHRLRHSVADARNPEGPHAVAMLFRYLHGLDRRREIALRGHAVPDPVQIVLQFLLEVLDGHAIDARSAPVLLYLLPRLPDLPLRDLERLACWLQLTHATPPRHRPVDRTSPATDDLAPWLHPHRTKQELPSYYEPVRQRRPATVLSPLRVLRLGCSLSPSANSLADGSVGTRLLTFHARAGDRARAAFTSDTIWPVSRFPPDSSQGRIKPRFDVI